MLYNFILPAGSLSTFSPGRLRRSEPPQIITPHEAEW